MKSVIIDEIAFKGIINSIRPKQVFGKIFHFGFLTMAASIIEIAPSISLIVEGRAAFGMKMIYCFVRQMGWKCIAIRTVLLSLSREYWQ